MCYAQTMRTFIPIAMVLLLTAFFMLRLVKPLGLGVRLSALLGLPIAAACGLYPLLAWADMSLDCPVEVPRGVMIVAVWAFQTIVLFFGLWLLSDVLRMAAWAVLRLVKRRPLGERWRRCNNVLNGALLAAVAVAVGVGEYKALLLPEVREVTIELEKYPAGAPPLRVALLADLHADCVKTAPFLRAMAERTNALQPDAILIAGDVVDGRVSKRGKDVAELRHLRAPLGVYGVSGNHEYFSGNAEWQAFLSGLGIRMLNNEHATLGPVVLAGVPDIFAVRAGGAVPDLAEALRGVPRSAPVVLLAHQPKFVQQAAFFGVDVQLSGHTHGGLIRGLDSVLAAFNDGYIAGYYRVRGLHGDTQLYVSRGSSLWTGDAIRLGVPSEITLITFRGCGR